MFNTGEWKDRPIDAKVITYLSEKEVGEDVHIVKEVKYHKGEYVDNIRIIKDFKRPFWVTKEIYRTYKDKKESEDIKKVDRFLSTDSRLAENIAPRLGSKYIGVKQLRPLLNSPYLYGIDVDARTFLKKLYLTKFNEHVSPYRVGTFDIEVDVLTDEIIIISLSTNEKTIVGVLKSFLKGRQNVEPEIRRLYDKYIPDVPTKQLPLEVKIFDHELDLIKWIFKKANYMNIDWLAAWNISYDLTKIIEKANQYNIDVADIFHYDKIPSKYKYFKFKKGPTQFVTEGGKVKPINPEEQWHTVKATTNYNFIDAMSAHRYVRVGGKTVPGGYRLDNILEYEGVHAKLKFPDLVDSSLQNLEWHMYMVKHRPIEYIIYNIWDTKSMIELDNKTKDLQVSVPLLLGVSHVDIFNSGPKKIVDALEFFYLEHGRVLGVRPANVDRDKLLGLNGWIVTMPAYRIDDNGISVEKGWLNTNIRLFVYDADAVSSYPSNIMAANVSKDTTHRELLDIEGIDRDTFMKQNINLIYGPTNAVEYCYNMFNFPKPTELLEMI